MAAMDEAEDSRPVGESPAESSADAADPSSTRREIPAWIWWPAVAVVALATRLAGDHLAAVKAAEQSMAAHRAVFAGAVISIAAAGLLLLVASMIQQVLQGGSDVSKPNPGNPIARGYQPGPLGSASKFKSAYRFKGKAVGIEVHDEWTIRQMKAAWRGGDWRSTPLWRRRYTAFAGIMFMVIGVCGICIVFAPAWVAILFVVMVLYVLGRIAWAFCRA